MDVHGGGDGGRWGRCWRARVLAHSTFVALHAVAVDAYPTTYLRPAVPYSALSISRGTDLYRERCAVCHGTGGHGDGPAARDLPRRPADLTARHTADHTAGDLFWWLSHGITGSPMPGFEDRLSVQDRWDLVNLLRALADAEQARRLRAWVQPGLWLVAPDFTFGLGVGPSVAPHPQVALLPFAPSHANWCWYKASLLRQTHRERRG